MFHRKLFQTLLSGFVILLFSSCQAFKDDNDIDETQLPKWTLSINELVKYPKASLGEKEVPTFSGKTVWIRKHYEFNSKSIKEITAVPTDKPDEFELKLKLDKQGSMIAMRLCNEKVHPPWGASIDGAYYKTIEVKKAQDTKFDDYTEIIINGPFTKELAEALAKYSEANYNHFHKNQDKDNNK